MRAASAGYDRERTVANVPPADRLFYDGDCGLCHRAVQFVLAHDRHGVFRFAPLDSDLFRAAVPEATRAGLPDSMVVVTGTGVVLTRSAAWLYIMRSLGGRWRLLAAGASIVPEAIRDWAYDGVAAVRHRLFARPSTVCPLLPDHIKGRFDL
jgi:predicted DCC family thiol-disulfide oxidoreductase YuxK